MENAALRLGFVRLLVESLHKDSGGRILGELRRRLSHRHALLLGDALNPATGEDVMPLSDGEALLFAIDTALSPSGGTALEHAGEQIASRIISGGKELFSQRHPAVVVWRLRGPLLHPFVNVPIAFDVATTETGLLVTVEASGYPLTVQVVRHLAVGFVRAALLHRQAIARVTSELFGERALVRGAYRVFDPANEVPESAQVSREVGPERALDTSLDVSRVRERPVIETEARRLENRPTRPDCPAVRLPSVIPETPESAPLVQRVAR